jgi:hypothetical protein
MLRHAVHSGVTAPARALPWRVLLALIAARFEQPQDVDLPPTSML